MSELSYAELDEDIDRLTGTIKTNTALFQLANGQISLKEAISKIYLEGMKTPPNKKKIRYKIQRFLR